MTGVDAAAWMEVCARGVAVHNHAPLHHHHNHNQDPRHKECVSRMCMTNCCVAPCASHTSASKMPPWDCTRWSYVCLELVNGAQHSQQKWAPQWHVMWLQPWSFSIAALHLRCTCRGKSDIPYMTVTWQLILLSTTQHPSSSLRFAFVSQLQNQVGADQ